MRLRALVAVTWLVMTLSLFPTAGASPVSAVTVPDTTLLIVQISPQYPDASRVRGEQVLMLLRHFDPNAELVVDADYHQGMASHFTRVVVLGNDASDPLQPDVLADVAEVDAPVLWVGYGLASTTRDPDFDLGFAPGFATTASGPVEVEYQGKRYPSGLDEYQTVRIADPDVRVFASVVTSGDRIPLAVQRGNRWFFATLPALDTDYPDPAIDAPTLIFADFLHDFFETKTHLPQQAIVRLEDVSAHIPPRRIIDAVDALADRGIPFVVGVIPAQRLADGSVLTIGDRPDFVQALRYAQDRGGTIALHGYHHTFGQGEDYEFWDAARKAPLEGEQWDTYALKVEDGLRVLRDQGIEPRLWETPHYAASPLAYRVFAHYFSDAIENRDPVAWMPYPSGPDQYGQELIPENLGYINEPAGLTVDAQLERARLLRIVRDATAVGFYHPANIPVGDLARMVDGLKAMGYTFGDVRNTKLSVNFAYEPDVAKRVATAIRIEPGLTVLELTQAVRGAIPFFGGDVPGRPGVVAFGALAIGLFLVRLRAQWRAIGPEHRTQLDEPRASGHRRLVVGVAVASVALVFGAFGARQTILVAVGPRPPTLVQSVATTPARPPAQTSGGWEISLYFTAVESFYHGPRVELRGCLVIDCTDGTADLGTFSRDFLAAVKQEGSGRLLPGSSHRYLNWSTSIGYWLDDAARDARGSILHPYVSAAADASIEYVTSLQVTDCGREIETGLPASSAVCAAIRASRWLVRDRFNVARVGKHVDLYVGEQPTADFISSDLTIHTRGASLVVQAPPRPS